LYSGASTASCSPARANGGRPAVPAGGQARAVTRRGADAGVDTSIAAGSAKRANSLAQLRALNIAITRAPSSGTLPHSPEAPQLPQVVELARRWSGTGSFFASRKLLRLSRDFTTRNQVLTPRQRRTRLFFHEAQRRMPSLWLGWWWRGESDSGFEQKFAYLLPDKIAHPGGGDIPCEQLDGMWPRPFSLLVGSLTAGPTAEGWQSAAGTDLEPLFADRTARSFAPSPFWSSGCHPEGLFDGFRQTLRQ
jgi:hypothetical protein